MVLNLKDKDGALSGKGLSFSLFGLLDNNGKHDAEVFERISKAIGELKIAPIEAYNAEMGNLSVTSQKFAKELAHSGKGAKEISQGFTIAAQSASKLTFASKAATLGMTLLNTAMNMGIMLAVSAAITGIVKGLDYLIVTLKEQKEIVEQASTEFKTLTSDIEALNKQLATSATRIDELNGKDTLSLIEQEELARLKETNTELAIQLALKEKDAELTAKKLAAETETLFNKSYNSVSLDENRVPDYKTQLQDNDTLLEDIIIGSNNISATVAAYEHLIDVRNKAIAQGSDGAEDAAKANEQLSAVETHLLEFSQSLQSMQSTLLDVENPSQAQLNILEQTSSWLNTINSLIIPEKWKSIKFDEVFNADDLKSTKEALMEAAKAGELDESSINKYSDFASRLSEVGISAKEAAAQLNAMYASQDGHQSPNFSAIIDPAIESFKNLNNQLDSIQSAYKTFTSAIDEYNQTGTLSLDTTQAILALGDEYIGYLFDENNQLQLNKEGFIALANAKLDKLEADALAAAIDNVRGLTDEATATEYLKGKTEDATTATEQNTIAELENLAVKKAAEGGNLKLATEQITATFNQYKSIIDATRAGLGSYTDATMGAADATKKLQEEQNKTLKAQGDAYTKAIDKQIAKLQEQKDAEAKYYDKRIDRLNREKEAINEKADAEDRELALAKKKAELDALKAASTVRVYDEDKGGFGYGKNQEAIDKAQEEYDSAKEEYDRYLAIKAIDDEIKKLEEAKKKSAESIDSQIEDWKELKDNISEQMSHIGETFEEHQLDMQLMADAEVMNYERMAQAARDYADACREALAAERKGGSGSSSSGGTSPSGGTSSSRSKADVQSDLNRVNTEYFAAKSQGAPKPTLDNYAKQQASLQSELNKAKKLAKGGIVTDPGLFITDEDGKKEVKAGVRAGKATLLDKGDMVFPHGAFPEDPFSLMMRVANEYPLIPSRIQESNDNMGKAINNTTVNRQEAVTLQFNGDLSFPNITKADDSEKLIRTLINMGRESYQLPG